MKNAHKIIFTAALLCATSCFTTATAAVERDPMLDVLDALAKNDKPRAENICRQQIERFKGTRSRNLAAAQSQLAGLLVDRKQGAEAEPLAIEAASIYEQVDGNPSLTYNSTMNVLALAYESQEKWDKAEPIVAKMVQAYRAPGTDQRLYAIVAERYTKILEHIPGREQEVQALKTQTKTIEAKTAPSEELGKLQMEGMRTFLAKDYVKAERIFRQALAKALRLYGTGDIRYGDCASGLANTLMMTNKYGEAEALLKQVLAIQQKNKSDQSSLTMSLIATCLRKQGKDDQAQALQDVAFKQSITTMRKSDPKMASKFQDMEKSMEDAKKRLEKTVGPISEIDNLSVKTNMRTVQLAALMYGIDNNGFYPAGVNMSLVSHFPGGDSARRQAGTAPSNPFTHAKEWPVFGKYVPASKLALMPPGQMVPGSIEYCVSPDRRSFTIRGGGKNGKALANGRGTLVFSEKK